MNDVLLAAYLTTITKGMNAMNDLVDKFNLAYGATHAAPAGPGAHERSMMGGKSSMMSPAGGRRRAVSDVWNLLYTHAYLDCSYTFLLAYASFSHMIYIAI